MARSDRFRLPPAKAVRPFGYHQMFGPDRGYNAHGWFVMTNAWNPGALKHGTDYSIDAIYSRVDMTKGTTFNWSYGQTTDLTAPIRAYPNVMFGIGPHGEQINPTDTVHVFPARVGSLGSLTATYDVTAKGNVGGYNVAYDIWFTTAPNGSTPTVTNELMIWVHRGDVQPFGTVIGSYSDGAFKGTLYRDGNYTALVADADMLKGTIDITKVIAHLETLGILSSDEYLACISLGAEVVSGNGAIRINDFDLNLVTTTGAGTVETVVTGAGSTSRTISANAADLLASGPADDLLFADAGSRAADAGATSEANRWFAQQDPADAFPNLVLTGPEALLGASDFLF